MSLSRASAVVNAMLAAVLATIDANGPALLDFFGNTRPAAGAAAGASPIVGITLAHPSGSVATQSLTLTTPVQGQCTSAGTIAWGRLYDGAGTWLLDFDAGLSSSGAEAILDRVTVYPGAFVTLTSAVFS
jgi:hypothetical protein